MCRPFKAQSFGRLQIDHKFEFSGSHDRQVGRLFAVENQPGIGTDLPQGIGKTGRVALQTTGLDALAQCIACRQRITRRERNEQFAMVDDKRACTYEQRTNAALSKCCKDCLNIAVAAGIGNYKLLPDCSRCGLYISSLRFGIRTRVAGPLTPAGAARP